MNCPMCGEPFDQWSPGIIEAYGRQSRTIREQCPTCGWSERLDPVNRERIAALASSLGLKVEVSSVPGTPRKGKGKR